MSALGPALLVSSSAGSYPIHFESGFEPLGPLLAARSRGRRVVVVTNPVVGALYAEPLRAALARAGLGATVFEIPDGEAFKTLGTWAGLVQAVLQAGVDRSTPVLALGGGVVGDVAGFAAATLLRGLPLVQVPTTLLAMVDSSVGGKTGVNTPEGKNLVGAFHPPVLVYAAMDTLETLPTDELRSGLGEVVKHGLLGDERLFEFCEREAPAIRARAPERLSELVRRSCAVKAAVVAADERELGPRAVLNLGHTVGHALETAAGYGALRHGEAVAIGLLAEARWAEARGACAPQLVLRLRAALDALGLRDRPPPLRRADVLAAAGVDKKRASGILRTPILRAVGHAEIIEIPSDEIPCMFERLAELTED